MSAPSMRLGIAYRLGSELAAKGLALAVTIGLSRGLGPEGWGRMQWGLSIAGLIAATADFGLGSLFLRGISQAKAGERRDWFKAAWILKAALWFAVILATAGLSAALPSEHRLLVYCAVAYTGVLSLAELNSFAFAGVERLDVDFWVSVVGKVAQAAAALLAMAWGHGPLGVLGSMAAAGLLSWAWSLLRLRAVLQAPSGSGWREYARQMLKGLWPFGLVPLTALAVTKADNFVLEHWLGAAALGVYHGAYKWLEALAFVPVAFVVAVFPALTRDAKARGSRTDQAHRALGITVAFGAGAVAVLWPLAALLPWLLGARYAGSASILRILAWGALFSYPSYVLGNMLVIHHRQGRILHAMGAGLAFSIAANMALVPRYGTGAAAAVAVLSAGVIAAVHIRSLGALLDARGFAGMLGKGLVAALAGAGAALWIGMLPGGAWIGVVAGPALTLWVTVKIGLFPLEELERIWGRITRPSLRTKD